MFPATGSISFFAASWNQLLLCCAQTRVDWFDCMRIQCIKFCIYG